MKGESPHVDEDADEEADKDKPSLMAVPKTRKRKLDAPKSDTPDTDASDTDTPE
jgi:cell division protease FtsH